VDAFSVANRCPPRRKTLYRAFLGAPTEILRHREAAWGEAAERGPAANAAELRLILWLIQSGHI